MVEVTEDLQRLGVKGWWMTARNKADWREVLRKPKLESSYRYL